MHKHLKGAGLLNEQSVGKIKISMFAEIRALQHISVHQLFGTLSCLLIHSFLEVIDCIICERANKHKTIPMLNMTP